MAPEGPPLVKFVDELAESGRFWRQTAPMKLKYPLRAPIGDAARAKMASSGMFEGALGHQNALFPLPTGGDLGLPVSLRSPTDPVFIENTCFHAADRRRGLGREEFYIGAGQHVRREIGVHSTVWAVHHHNFQDISGHCCGWIPVLDVQHSLSVSA